MSALPSVCSKFSDPLMGRGAKVIAIKNHGNPRRIIMQQTTRSSWKILLPHQDLLWFTVDMRIGLGHFESSSIYVRQLEMDWQGCSMLVNR